MVWLTSALLSLPLARVTAQSIPSDTLRLHPGDVVRVQVWREPLYNGDFPVDEGGYATLPLVGRRIVTATPWGLLRDSLITQYRASLNTTAVNLTPLRRIFVLGAVLKPGIYMLEPAVGVEGAVALAGGANEDGTLEKLRIIRDGHTIVKNLSITKSLSAYTLASGDQVFVDRRSWVDRNSALLLSSFISFTGVMAALLR
jgi:protein involved in polysaccharide export with SLBB domain